MTDWTANDDLRLLFGARARVAPEHMAAVFDTTPDAIAARLRDLCGGDPDHASLSAAIVARANGPLSEPETAVEPVSAVGVPSDAKAALRPAPALCEDASIIDDIAEAKAILDALLADPDNAVGLVVVVARENGADIDVETFFSVPAGCDDVFADAYDEAMASIADSEPEAAPAPWVN